MTKVKKKNNFARAAPFCTSLCDCFHDYTCYAGNVVCSHSLFLIAAHFHFRGP